MGLIHIDLFASLDLVAQAPGGPDEDTEGGFAFGGWQAPFTDEIGGREVGAGMAGMDALLLGRKTYDIFAGYWPQHESGLDGEIGRLFGRIPKYVASRNRPELAWNNSHLLGSELAAEVRALRDRHEQVHVIGSVNFVQTLIAEGLFDRLNLWLYPLLLGSGKRVFATGAVPTSLQLLTPPVTTTTGAVVLHYARLDEPPRTGDMSQPDRGLDE